jgi:hypothetical protein
MEPHEGGSTASIGDLNDQLRTTPATVAEATFASIPGQYNLFTGEVEPIAGLGEQEPQPETPWLFDPDFGLVLPEDRAGKEILVEEGIAPSFRGIGNGEWGVGESGSRAWNPEHRAS